MFQKYKNLPEKQGGFTIIGIAMKRFGC